jgi:hypothetical protein
MLCLERCQPQAGCLAVTQEVIMSMSKTPWLTFLHSDNRATSVTVQGGMPAQGLARDWGSLKQGKSSCKCLSPLPPSSTSEDLGGDTFDRALIIPWVGSTHLHTVTNMHHTLTHPHACTSTYSHMLIPIHPHTHTHSPAHIHACKLPHTHFGTTHTHTLTLTLACNMHTFSHT